MRPSQNAPEWFGGSDRNMGNHPRAEGSRTSSSSRRPSSSSDRNRERTGSASRRKASHQRKRSKELLDFPQQEEGQPSQQQHSHSSLSHAHAHSSHPHPHGQLPQDGTSRHSSSTNERKSRKKSSSGRKKDKDRSGSKKKKKDKSSSKDKEKAKKSSSSQRKPSFVERLFGISQPPDDHDDVSSSSKNDDSKHTRDRDRDRPRNERQHSIGSAKSDPYSNSSPQKLEAEESKSGERKHRRIRSDPSQFRQLTQHDYNQFFPQESKYASGPLSPTVQSMSLSGLSLSPTHPSYRPRSMNDNGNGHGNMNLNVNLEEAGTESDDVLVYSEDESTSLPKGTQYMPPPPHNPHLYPSQYQTAESKQMMEHNQMMAIAPNHKFVAFSRHPQTFPHSHQHHNQHTHQHHSYGAINSDPGRSEFYLSEDDTLSSRSFSLSSRSQRQKYTPMYNSNGSGSGNNAADSVSNSIPEEENGRTELSALLSPTNSHNNNSASSDKSNPSRSGNSGSSHSHSHGSKRHGNGNGHKFSPPGQSTASSTSSGSDSNRIVRPLHSPNGTGTSKPIPPAEHNHNPPVKSVSIHARTISSSTGTTATTTSTSGYSPHNMLRLPNHTHVPMGIPTIQPILSSPIQRRYTRKELKRLTRRIEIEEEKEDKIQAIIRQGQESALDWSQHVSQEVRGLNRPAGFFPHKQKKYHDVAFAVLFLVQMVTVLYIGWIYSGETMMDSLKLSSFESSGSISGAGAGASAGSGSASTAMHTGKFTGLVSTSAFGGGPDPYNDDPFSSGSDLNLGRGSTLSNWAKDIHVDYCNALQLACITALYATSLAALFIGMMMILGKALIQTVLCLLVIVCIGFGTIGVALTPYSSIPIFGIILLAFSLGYSIVVWDRIPFAATNLDTALCGVKCSADVLIVSLLIVVCAFFWSIGWAVAFLGVYDHYLDKSDMTWGGLFTYLGMFISFFWTLNVMKNIIHVTIAGVVTSWWTDPDSLTSCCNNVLRTQFALSLTSSFGSICLGSLVSPTLEVLRHTLGICCNSYSTQPPQPFEPTHDNVLGDLSVHSDPSNLALLPIPKSPIDGAIKYFNDYGFTYMGIYREDFKTSSRKAREVFETREWVGVVSDKLIEIVLQIVIVLITLVSGAFGLVVEEFDGYSFTNFQKPTSTAFFIGCVIGWVVSSVCLKVVSSSVSTVLVCFSLAPWKFSVNHPVLSKEMRASWGGIWLDEYDWLNMEERGESF